MTTFKLSDITRVHLDLMAETYRQEAERWAASPLYRWYYTSNGWPKRFHLFPRLDAQAARLREWWNRIQVARDVLRGRHECGY